jgi:hypothetical protein
MKLLKNLKVTIKKVSYVTIDISPENGYDDFPDTALDMYEYIKDVKQNVAQFYVTGEEDEVEYSVIDMLETYD